MGEGEAVGRRGRASECMCVCVYLCVCALPAFLRPVVRASRLPPYDTPPERVIIFSFRKSLRYGSSVL